MGRNRLDRELPTALLWAIGAYARVKTYPREDLSDNEKAILALGDELMRMRRVANRVDCQACRNQVPAVIR